MRKNSWVIAANGTYARIFKTAGGRQLTELDMLVHTESRLHTGDLISDKSGRSFSSHQRGGGAGNTQRPSGSPKEQEANKFARDLVKRLEGGLNSGEFEQLYIAASPALLGILRTLLNSSTAQCIAKEVNRDLTHLKPIEIREYFL